MVTLSLVYRTLIFYWQNIKYRCGILIALYLIIIGSKRFTHQSFNNVFNGIQQSNGTFELPLVWLVLSFIPIMITGNVFFELVRKQYIFVNKVSVGKYLLSLMVVSLILNAVFPIINYVVFWGNIKDSRFFIMYFTINYLVTFLYGFISILVDAIITEVVFLSVFIMATAFNNFPIISQLMYVRQGEILNWQNTITSIIIIGIMIMIKLRLKKIDFIN